MSLVHLIGFGSVSSKPKTKRAKRFLESRAPKLSEDGKTTMIMKGGNASLTVTQALKDIVSNLRTFKYLTSKCIYQLCCNGFVNQVSVDGCK